MTRIQFQWKPTVKSKGHVVRLVRHEWEREGENGKSIMLFPLEDFERFAAADGVALARVSN